MVAQHKKAIQKIFITDNNSVLLQCRECHFSKEVNVSRYKKIDASVTLKVKCPCGNTYPVTLERRKYYRKDTNLSGEFRFYSPKGRNQMDKMTVMNISKGGIKIKMLTVPLFNKGDIIEVGFRLDNQNRTSIKKKGFVRNIKNFSVDVEFCAYDPLDHGDRAIGFYLF